MQPDCALKSSAAAAANANELPFAMKQVVDGAGRSMIGAAERRSFNDDARRSNFDNFFDLVSREQVS